MKRMNVNLRMWKQSLGLVLATATLQSCISVYSDGEKITTKHDKALAKREAALANKEVQLAEREARLAQREAGLLGKEHSSSRVIIDNKSDNKDNQVTREYAVSPFRKIRQNGVASIVFTQGSECKVSASGSENMVALTTVNVNNEGTLVIDTRKSKGNNNSVKTGVTVRITAPSLDYIKLDGVGSFTADGKVIFQNDFRIDHDGVGSLSLKNITAPTLMVNHDGVGSVSINTSSPVVAYNHDGVGGSTLSVNSDQVKVTLDGVGGLKITGKTRKYSRRRDGVGRLNDKGLTVTEE